VSRWLAALPLLALAALAVLFAAYALHRNPQVDPKALVGKPMPAIAIPGLEDGRPVPLVQAAAGQPTFVNFFASWCAPCEVEHPVVKALAAKGVRIVGIAYKDSPDNAQAYLTRLGDPYAVRLVDRDGRAGIEFGVTGVPETFVVDTRGVILAKHTGPLTAQAAETLAAKLR
jgi:cytochrome c biogenesis protein CcmG/thiol:disulfide interchange protein DsbE